MPDLLMTAGEYSQACIGDQDCLSQYINERHILINQRIIGDTRFIMFDDTKKAKAFHNNVHKCHHCPSRHLAADGGFGQGFPFSAQVTPPLLLPPPPPPPPP